MSQRLSLHGTPAFASHMDHSGSLLLHLRALLPTSLRRSRRLDTIRQRRNHAQTTRNYLIIPDGPRPRIFGASLGATKEMYRPYMTEEQRRVAPKRPVPAGCDGNGPPAALRRLAVEYMGGASVY